MFGPKHSTEYRDYLRSPQWQIVRQHALRAAHYRCEHCGKTRRQAGWLEVNHKHYRTPFGQERWPNDIEALCHRCHRKADKARQKQNDPVGYYRRLLIRTCAVWLMTVVCVAGIFEIVRRAFPS